MHPNLMHPSGKGPAEDHAGFAVEVHSLELGATLLAVGGHFADADLVAHHLHRLAALASTPARKKKHDYEWKKKNVEEFGKKL